MRHRPNHRLNRLKARLRIRNETQMLIYLAQLGYREEFDLIASTYDGWFGWLWDLFAVSTEDRAWLDMVAIGQEFGADGIYE